MNAFSSGAIQDPAKRLLLGDLWSTLFMVVPSLSTTFASIDRMLGDLPAKSLGWLLVDEAGQALPQAAIGANMRAKRTIVVGDPIQIPPVVTMPERPINEIRKRFCVTPADWVAPTTSAQTLADRVCRFQATFKTADGSHIVAAPLLVHRRCQEPMFGISNRAYANQMVHAVGQRNGGDIERALGTSCWLNIDSTADTKWSPSEGEVVVLLLKRLAAAAVVAPDIFIITPFRIVASEMRRCLESETELFSIWGLQPDDWVRDRVGTIHTFQGREAHTVSSCLALRALRSQGPGVGQAKSQTSSTSRFPERSRTFMSSGLTELGREPAFLEKLL
jgi:hypothetical protein